MSVYSIHVISVNWNGSGYGHPGGDGGSDSEGEVGVEGSCGHGEIVYIYHTYEKWKVS